MQSLLSTIQHSLSQSRTAFALRVFVSYDALGRRKESVVVDIEQPRPPLLTPRHTIRLITPVAPLSSVSPLAPFPPASLAPANPFSRSPTLHVPASSPASPSLAHSSIEASWLSPTCPSLRHRHSQHRRFFSQPSSPLPLTPATACFPLALFLSLARSLLLCGYCFCRPSNPRRPASLVHCQCPNTPACRHRRCCGRRDGRRQRRRNACRNRLGGRAASAARQEEGAEEGEEEAMEAAAKGARDGVG